MRTTRRNVLRGFSAAGALSAFACLASDLPALSQSAQDEPSNESAYDFWTHGIREVAAPRTRSLDLTDTPHAVFVFYDKHNGFVTGSDIGDVGLPDRGDLNLLVNVDHIHLSRDDQAKSTHLEGGSLRIDLQQASPLPSLSERLAWTAIAGLLADEKKIPTAREMNFDPGTTWGKLQSVPLPDGGGHWTWNFFLQHRKSRWVQLVELMRKDTSLLAPIFGFGLPAIAITALQTVDRIVAELTRDANTEWLFQSPDIFVYGTKKARDSFEGSKLRLKQGMYVIVPSTQVGYLSKQASALEIKDGTIVPKNTSSLDVFEASTQTLPEVTYLTVGITARASAAPPHTT
jgi:hypothetical protein